MKSKKKVEPEEKESDSCLGILLVVALVAAVCLIPVVEATVALVLGLVAVLATVAMCWEMIVDFFRDKSEDE